MIRTLGIDQLKPSQFRREQGYPPVREATLERIRVFGVINPIPVRAIGDDHYEMLSNEETWLAAQRLGLHELPVYVVEGLTSQTAKSYAQSFTPTDPVTEAEGYAKLLGITVGQTPAYGAVSTLATQLGRHRTTVAHALRLLNLPTLVQEALRVGALSSTHGKVLLGVSDEEAQTILCTKVIQHRWSVRQLRKAVSRQRDKAVRRSPEIKRLETQLTEMIGSRVRIDEEAGVLSIDFARSLDVLDGILLKLGYTQHTLD